MDGLFQDLKFACRTLSRKRVFTLVAVLTLSLGIGANTAVFSLVNGILFKPVPGIADTETLVDVNRILSGDYFDSAHRMFEVLRGETRTLEDLAAFSPTAMAFSQREDPVIYTGLMVSDNYFSVLGMEPEVGRFFFPGESHPAPAVAGVVISDRIWDLRFGRDPGILGAAVRVNGHPVQLIGVAPRGFGGHFAALQVDLFVPLGLPAPGLHSIEGLTHPNTSNVELIGRLKSGLEPEAASAELTELAERFRQEHLPGNRPGQRFVVSRWAPLPAMVRTPVAAFFAAMMVIVFLLLAVACVNVANMILSMSQERSSEMAIRLALGAGRKRLVRQLLTESLVLYCCAGLLGVVLAFGATRLLSRLTPLLPAGLNLKLDLSPDSTVLFFTIFVSVLTGILFTVGPALRSSRTGPGTALKASSVTGGQSRTRLRTFMVAGQMAATVVLLVSAGLFLRSLDALRSVDAGWDATDVYAVEMDLELAGYAGQRGEAFFRELTTRVRQLPGVESAALARKIPLGGRASLGDINVADVPTPEGQYGFAAYYNTVSQGYFETLALQILQGSDDAFGDFAPEKPIALINQTMAARFWPGSSPIGQAFYLGKVAGGRSIEVVGVVEDAKYSRLTELPTNFYYLPFSQRYNSQATLHLKVPPEATGTAVPAVRSLIAELDPVLPVLSVRSLEESLGIFSLPQRLAAWVAGATGLLGLLLGSIGVYGVTAFAIGGRTRELGIRMAVGAGRSDILRLVVLQGMRAPLTGLLVGLGVCAGVTRLLAGLLPGVSALDPVTFLTVTAVLTVTALSAVVLPARRAVRLNPVRTLRFQ